MRRYTSMPLSAFALGILSLALSFQSHAQTAQPITSLPKPPGDTSAPASAPVYNPPAQSDQTNAVHPITSLPKPPQPTEPAVNTYPNPAVPAYQAPATTTPEPVVTPSATAPSTPSPAPDHYPAPSTSIPPPPQPVPTLDTAPLHVSIPPAEQPRVIRPKPIHPFSTAAVAIKVGFAGIGVDIATPLASRFNLRAGGSFFSYSGSFNSDGITINGDLKFRSGTASLDWFPFNSSFRISPGITFYNGNNLNATVLVPGGQTFSLGDTNYTSSNADPVNGTAAVNFGRRTAPSLTIGFGNMIPRSGRHISFPFEIGFQYIGPPTLTFNLSGIACTNSNDPATCSPIQTNAQTQANIQQQESKIDSDIELLRFYPIISQGVSVRF